MVGRDDGGRNVGVDDPKDNIKKLVELGMISREGNNRTDAWKVNRNEAK
ncbi:MAG: hypothetical protein Q4Q58_04465 [Thermoplasmata archaeon]|nr:hypothetical protein [Thermoplasmata archaeon]